MIMRHAFKTNVIILDTLLPINLYSVANCYYQTILVF